MKLPKTMPAPMRHKSQPRRPVWILVLVALVSISLIAAYVYPPGHQSTCYFLSSRLCSAFKDWLPPLSARVLSDDELASSVVIRDILSLPSVPAKKPKATFMFLPPGSLPFEKLWENFLCSFHLSYNMLLNQPRSEDGDPENLLCTS